jgi:acyl carrier protein
MNTTEILSELNIIFRKVFENNEIVVLETTTANDIDDWDSLNHAILLSAIEKHFNVKFKLSEMMGFKNVGNICNAVQSKLK